MISKYVLVFIYIFNCSITDIEHSPNYITFGLPQTHEVRL